MTERKTPGSSNPVVAKAVAASYQNLGTFKTAKNIVKHRGIAGLYSGFNLHLSKCNEIITLGAILILVQ